MAFLQRMKQGFGSTFSFFSDSWAELKKVKWPTRKELISYTLVVLVTCAFMTIYFWVIDLGLSEILRLFD
ncbi:preprotein translocase subunit SecE [Paenibacillus ginsengarvi]|uniref:Protein translocase subunit SecE n=1 Tax=Paenibacillus ginsengarvi TaxID=400777 RepID=A0A3B0AZ04_9BACL|nr:preprotein translocase subunit SecE [Paenibacillus ginsengarvi]RKN65177.1 preprotein translocase subunit SecE [Paenibacillus ginsengarvi]